MRSSDSGRTQWAPATDGTAAAERPRRLADAERDTPTSVRDSRHTLSAPFGAAAPLGVALAVVIAVGARAVAVAADGVLTASDRSTLVALGLADSLGSVATAGTAVARLGGVVAVVGAGYCLASVSVWMYLRRGDGDDRTGAHGRPESRSR